MDSDDSLCEVGKRPIKKPVGRPKRKMNSDSGYYTKSPSITEHKNVSVNIKTQRPVSRPKKDATLEKNTDLNTNKSNKISVSNNSNCQFFSDAPFTGLRKNFVKSSTSQQNYCELDLELYENNPFEGNDIIRNVANILAEYKMK